MLTGLILVVLKPLFVNYGTFLVLSCVLLVFVIKLSALEKALFMAVIVLFSFQQYIMTLGETFGGVVEAITFVTSPATYAYLLFVSLIFYMVQRRIALRGTD